MTSPPTKFRERDEPGEHSSGGLQSVHCLAAIEQVVNFFGHDLQLPLE